MEPTSEGCGIFSQLPPTAPLASQLDHIELTTENRTMSKMANPTILYWPKSEKYELLSAFGEFMQQKPPRARASIEHNAYILT